nr:alpha-n-acetylglucosaminidase [Quercus suber]
MMETFMTTQVAHGQILNDLISNVATLKADFTGYRSSFPPPPPLNVMVAFDNMINGTTAIEIASGLYWYLKYWCGANVSWDKTGGVLIASIPKPGSSGLFFNSLHSMMREFSQNMDANEDLSPTVMDANEDLSPRVASRAADNKEAFALIEKMIDEYEKNVEAIAAKNVAGHQLPHQMPLCSGAENLDPNQHLEDLVERAKGS